MTSTLATTAPLPGAVAEPERRASWLELFFDLCFVVAVGAVAHVLHDEPSIEGIALFAALFIPVWWSWMEYAWYATSFPERGAFNRFGAFAAMLTVLAMATQVGSASHGDPRGFILAFVVFHAIVVALFLRAARLYPERQVFSIRYASGFGLAAAIWLVSLALPEEIRPWIWIAALAVDLVTPWMAVLAVVERTFDVSHIPERYGLFTIIVLGEAIIAVARSMSEAQWTPEAVTAAVAGFAIAVVIWWAYFAHPHAELLERGRLASFIWGYGHIFVWMGIAITGDRHRAGNRSRRHRARSFRRRAAHPLWGSGPVPGGDGDSYARRAPAISPIVWCWFGWRRQSHSSSSGSPARRCRRRQLPS